MSVSVVVPSWRRSAELAECLAGLAAQTRTPDEVVVVARPDDHATWDLIGRIEQGSVRGVAVEGEGVVAGLNAGFAAATGDIVAVTDDDAVPRPDWLERIEAAFAQGEDIGGVGGRDWVH